MMMETIPMDELSDSCLQNESNRSSRADTNQIKIETKKKNEIPV